MKNNKMNIWVAMLTMMAIVLGVMLVAGPQREAQAAMVNPQAGFTLLTTGTPNGDEVLVVVDKGTQRMVMYRLNGNSLDLVGGTDFSRSFK